MSHFHPKHLGLKMSDQHNVSADLSFLIGKSLEQVCIGQYQVILNFFSGGSVEAACGLEVTRGDHTRKVSLEYDVGVGTELASFLGKDLSRIVRKEGTLSLWFGDAECARFLLKDDGNESVNVSGGPRGNVTFYY